MQPKPKTDYYVYALCDPRHAFDDAGLAHRPFYIGKGRGDRYKMHIKEASGLRKPRNKNSLRSVCLLDIHDAGYEPEVVFLHTQMLEDDAYDAEVTLIRKFGRIGFDPDGLLTNRIIDQRSYQSGGYQRPPRTREHIEHLRASRAGYRHNDAAKQKMALRKVGTKQSDDHISNRMAYMQCRGNPNALSWEVVTPEGITHKIKGLRTWCKQQNLDYFTVYHSRDGYKATRCGVGKGGRPKADSNINHVVPKIIGHCLVRDIDSREILADKLNSINFEAVSYALAASLGGRPNSSIMEMIFGNGASSVSAVGTISYLPPNVSGMHATLYNQTYAKFVNDMSPLDTDPTNNFIRINHTLGNTFSDIVVTCLLDYNEPSGQAAFDDATDVTGTYIFDEIGLRTYDPSNGSGLLLSHVIFHPVQKSLNRRIEIIYTLRVIMV